MLVGPRIEIKAVEGDPLPPDRDLGEQRADRGDEAVAIHAEVGGRVAQPDEAGKDGEGQLLDAHSGCRPGIVWELRSLASPERRERTAGFPP